MKEVAENFNITLVDTENMHDTISERFFNDWKLYRADIEHLFKLNKLHHHLLRNALNALEDICGERCHNKEICLARQVINDAETQLQKHINVYKEPSNE